MNKTVNGALCAGVLFFSLAASVDAVPITEQSLIHVRQAETTFSSAFLLDNFTTTDNSVSHTLDTTAGLSSTIQGRASLITGETGTSVAISTSDPSIRGASSSVMLFDTLTFTPDPSLPILPGAIPISYGLHFDGSLAHTSPAGGASVAKSIVTLYDITGLATWLTQTVLDPAYPTDIFVSSNAPVVSTLGINLLVGPQSTVNSLPAQGWDQAIGNTDGTVFDFNLSKTETFLADPTKTYGISIWTSSSVGGLNPMGSLSDFLNTSTFGFTNLNGATFTSGSGAFLTAAVPEPSVLALLGIGMIAIWLCRQSRRVEDQKPCSA